ncbi:MAG: GGDEF domain-containing phosphodiesterase [Lachnospiraceae bacterium]|nr:GGDEF domain-containing phosphodiesterase [Lachnospiraceae bacterium]
MTENFSGQFEKLIDVFVDYEHRSRKNLIDVLFETGKMFRLTKVVSEFYRNATDQRDGKGEILCEYDIGPAEKVVMCKSVTALSGAIVKCTAYTSNDQPPYSDEELRQLDLCMRALQSFISRSRMQRAIETLGYHDEDGYPNFPYYFRYLERMNATCGFKDQVALIYNLRQFSIINRDLGNQTGNVVMRSHYEAMKEIVGEQGIVCRVGGDNFAMIFSADKLKSVLKAMEGIPVLYDKDNDRRVMVSACAGVFIIPPDFVFERPGSIVELVFPACQKAKLEKDGIIEYVSKKSFEEREKFLRVRRSFEEGLAKEEFRAYYQPKVDVLTGKIVGAEALCRWIRDGRVVPPMDFIPILEQNTDICSLDFYMLEKVCKDISRRLSEGRKVVRVSVNFSRKHLLDVDLLENIVRVIEKNKVPYKYIEIELTETNTEVDFKKLQRLVNGLQEVGISAAVDDFGVGYSSLNLVRELPWNVLKIDRSLLPGMENERKKLSTIVFGHIVSLANAMGIECITEGVETAEQVELLKEYGCPAAQGFYYDKPLPYEEYEKKLDIGKY